MASASPATYALLGLLATRSWTGYELTQQVKRSLRYAWPTSDGHLYREQKRLVKLGWASVEDEPVGARTRKRYAITDDGRDALERWLATTPDEPQLHVESVLRAFYADRGSTDDLTSSLARSAEDARQVLRDIAAIVAEYRSDGGPLALLEAGAGGPGQRVRFRGRPMFPERLHAVALSLEMIATMMGAVETVCGQLADEVADWPATDDPTLTPATRARLTRLAARLPDPGPV